MLDLLLAVVFFTCFSQLGSEAMASKISHAAVALSLVSTMGVYSRPNCLAMHPPVLFLSYLPACLILAAFAEGHMLTGHGGRLLLALPLAHGEFV